MASSALRVLPGLALCCVLAAVPGPQSRAGEEGGEEAAAAAMRLFTGQCAPCHAVPDPALATGRAWIDQVHRTA